MFRIWFSNTIPFLHSPTKKTTTNKKQHRRSEQEAVFSPVQTYRGSPSPLLFSYPFRPLRWSFRRVPENTFPRVSECDTCWRRQWFLILILCEINLLCLCNEISHFYWLNWLIVLFLVCWLRSLLRMLVIWG